MNQNRRAFLDMIAYAEGTGHLGDRGYNVMVGGTLFESYADHPRKLVTLNSRLQSTAAGRYQLLSRYYDHYKRLLGLKDFSPEAQDAIAIQQIKEFGALRDIDEGRVGDALFKCRKLWASLPGAGYCQQERSFQSLLVAYLDAGGLETRAEE